MIQARFNGADNGHGADAENQAGADKTIHKVAVFDMQLFFDGNSDMVEPLIKMSPFTQHAADNQADDDHNVLVAGQGHF